MRSNFREMSLMIKMFSSFRIFVTFILFTYIFLSFIKHISTVQLIEEENNNLFNIHSTVKVKRSSRYYCGQQLVDTLTLLCRNGYNKRRGGGEQYPYSAQIKRMLNSGKDFPPSSEMLADTDALIEQFDDEKWVEVFQRNIRGVSDDCCAKPCTRATMSSYCKP